MLVTKSWFVNSSIKKKVDMDNFIFTWDNLKYSVNEESNWFWNGNQKKRVIIDGVSGFAFSGSVIAVMGVSGSGKTTLLTILSGQRRGTGVLKINGRVVSGKMLRSNSAFLQEKDLFIETLTVYEHVTFMAAMCLYKPYSARMMTVHKLLRDLNLEKLKYTKIQYLSTGEKRALSLASKLLLEPYILFYDEPTTGLDSFSAISVVRILETIAASGKIVFLTVHQPTSPVFELFDNILLLSANGKVVFQGSKEMAKGFFESQYLFCPSAYNPADFYMKTITAVSSLDENRVENLIKVYKDEYAVKFDFSNIDYNGLLLKLRTDEKNFFYTLGWLTWRVFIDMKRNLKQYFVNFLLIVLTAFIIGLTYSSITVNEPNSVQGIQGALLLIVSELIFNEMCQVIYVFPSEIEVFVQEKNLYSAFPYFLSKIVSLIPFGAIRSLGFLTAYFICLQFLDGLQIFMEMYLVLLGTSFGGNALGLCLSAVFPTVETIQLFMVPLEIICLILSGLWIKIDTLPKIFGIIKYFSPLYISFESLCIIFWMKVGRMDYCSGVKKMPCFHNGTEVLENYDFIPSYDKIWENYMYLLLLVAVYCYIGYIGILRKRALCQI